MSFSLKKDSTTTLLSPSLRVTLTNLDKLDLSNLLKKHSASEKVSTKIFINTITTNTLSTDKNIFIKGYLLRVAESVACFWRGIHIFPSYFFLIIDRLKLVRYLNQQI